MKKYKSILPALLVMLTLTIVSALQNDAKGQNDYVQGIWTGTVSMHQKFNNLIGWNELWIDISFVENRGSGTLKYKTELILDGKSFGKVSCNGAGKAELIELIINRAAGTYSFHALGPSYTCIPANEEMGAGTRDISILDQPLGTNPNLLSGSETIINDLGGKGTTTITWNLYQGPVDAELIITPIAYDIWMPTASPDELRKGSVMDIDLKVQARNRGNSSLKAVRFELRLNKTSKEPGTTLNLPLNPSSKQLPDIRFLPHSIGESIDEDQFIEISCVDGKTGTATLASYDGGGWTTLTAVAVLEGGIRIEGMLLNPGGVKDIPIPKRDPGSHIAKAWLTANGNPGETDDKEKKAPNLNIGDGLTAYEEYRGVITKGEFKRLKPTVKELGVMVKRAEADLFKDGISLFETASGIKVIRFDETEIGSDRRLNKNFKTSHDYEQYVLKLENGVTTKRAAGENRPVTLEFMIPRQSDLVVVNVDWIEKFHHIQDSIIRTEGKQMPYTKNELLASTVAHELAHGVNVNHHGKPSVTPQNRIAYDDSHPPYHVFNPVPPGTEIPSSTWRFDAVLGKRSYLIDGITGTAGNEESGDLSCIMAYTSNYQWAFRTSNSDGSLYYYRVPVLPVGKKLCSSKTGTGINAASVRGVNKVNRYFGDAGPAPDEGNCLNQIKLRD